MRCSHNWDDPPPLFGAVSYGMQEGAGRGVRREARDTPCRGTAEGLATSQPEDGETRAVLQRIDHLDTQLLQLERDLAHYLEMAELPDPFSEN
ncbi:hypothetical protein [Treponema paraluiscuniculi]|uniref:Uncharacterized protein n=1 Tax=Treponema paraluiscuniculi TaxID=53435 RepID=A0ABY9E1V2_9SPIR|nr:hypothetical protein [Treponema paraluiscuniculi]WKC72535.1 hypothetical protein TPLL2_0676 [Treponema paraluiscuniculi]